MKFLIFFSLFFIGANCQTTPDYTKVFLIFVGDTLTDYVNVSLTSSLASISGTPGFLVPTYTKYYNPSRPTVIYTNGWRLNYGSDDAKLILGNYLAARPRLNYNIAFIDWSAYTRTFVYINTIAAIPETSKTTWNIINRLRLDPLINFDVTNTHLIGYDLGAHFAYMVADNIYFDMYLGKFPPRRLQRLTGLDPAGLFEFGGFIFGFFQVNSIERGRADFTDIIHTSANKFGTGPSGGDIEFYPNGGETQPGCSAKKSIQDFLANEDITKLDRLACSHSRAWEYYAESILSTSNTIFFSLECFGLAALFPYNAEKCVGGGPNPNSSMGFYAYDRRPLIIPTTVNYWLATNNVSTYSLS